MADRQKKNDRLSPEGENESAASGQVGEGKCGAGATFLFCRKEIFFLRSKGAAGPSILGRDVANTRVRALGLRQVRVLPSGSGGRSGLCQGRVPPGWQLSVVGLFGKDGALAENYN